MVGGDAVAADGQPVFARGIAFVALPAVGGVVGGQPFHIGVAVGLGQHRCGGDVRIAAVASDDAGVGNRECRAETVAVDGQKLGRLTVRYGLYASPTCLAIPLYGFVACGVYVASDTLSTAVASWLFVRSMRNFCAAFRNGYTFNATFRAALYLGLLPLVSVAALPLPVLIVPAVFCFKRTLRECAVALFGLLLPVAATCYVGWAAGDGFLAPLEGMAAAFLTPSGYRLFDGMSPFTLAYAGLLLFLTLWSVFSFFVDFFGMGIRQRAVLCFALFALFFCGGLFAAPCATVSVLALAAVPVSVLMPLVFVRIHKTCSLTLYAALFVLFALSQSLR